NFRNALANAERRYVCEGWQYLRVLTRGECVVPLPLWQTPRPLLAHLGPHAMSAFLPLLGDKRTSNAPSPGAAFMSTRRSGRAQPFEAQQGDCWRLSVSA